MKKLYFLISLMFIASSGFAQTQNKIAPGDTIGMYLINFDSTINYIHIDTSIQNLWQIGTPQKTFFNTPYSAPNVIMTDTINNYPVNNHSWFDLYIGNFNFSCGYPVDIFISFMHKIDSDTLMDGGYITVSWDKGLTWLNVIEDTIYDNYIGDLSPGGGFEVLNLYAPTDTLYNGQYGFSGKSNGWVNTVMSWVLFPMKFDYPPDTMIVRFNFISDSINNPREGWMIDDIRLYSIDLGSGIHELYNSNCNINIFPNPTNDNLTIETPDKATIEIINIEGQIIRTINTAEKQTTIDLRNLSSGVYIIKAKTERGVAVKKFIKE